MVFYVPVKILPSYRGGPFLDGGFLNMKFRDVREDYVETNQPMSRQLTYFFTLGTA